MVAVQFLLAHVHLFFRPASGAVGAVWQCSYSVADPFSEIVHLWFESCHRFGSLISCRVLRGFALQDADGCRLTQHPSLFVVMELLVCGSGDVVVHFPAVGFGLGKFDQRYYWDSLAGQNVSGSDMDVVECCTYEIGHIVVVDKVQDVVASAVFDGCRFVGEIFLFLC